MTNPLTSPLPPHIADLAAAGALFLLNHSGGKDSQAMFAYMTAHLPASQIVVVHADLGNVEWAGVQDHIRENIGRFDLNVVRAGKTLFQAIEARHEKLQAEGRDAAPWPSSQWRYCTSDLKRGPVAKFMRHYVKASGHRLVVNCLGLRAEESTARAKRPAFKTLTRECTRSRTVTEWLPIQDWTIGQVWQALDDSGQTRHWAYDKGMSRLSCCFCILASKADLTIAAQENPDLYRDYVDLEKRTGYTMRAGESLEEITGIKLESQDSLKTAKGKTMTNQPKPGEIWQLHFGAIEGSGANAKVLPEPFGSGRRLLFILASGRKWVLAANPATLELGKVHIRDWPKHRPQCVDANTRRALRRVRARRARMKRLAVPFAVKTLRKYLGALERGLR